MSNIDRFFIKLGYTPNDKAVNYSTEGTKQQYFWTPDRLFKSQKNIYQYHAYQLAKDIVIRNGLKTGLDLACGTAEKTRDILLPVLEKIELIDHPECEKIASSNMPWSNFIGVDLETIDLDLRREFDLIICADVLEHLKNPIPCLEFTKSHLSSTGFAVFSTPERDILRGIDCTVSPHSAHVREWNSTEFQLLLEHVGFCLVDQKFLPGMKINSMQEIFRSLAIKVFGPDVSLQRMNQFKNWFSCQTVVCMLSQN